MASEASGTDFSAVVFKFCGNIKKVKYFENYEIYTQVPKVMG
jgi:hypothetical protein